jgi:PAS domain-containing protein
MNEVKHNGVTHILVADKPEAENEMLREAFAAYGPAFRLTIVHTLRHAREAIERDRPNLVISAPKLIDGEAPELLPARRNQREYPLIVIADEADTTSAVAAMKAGAMDYVVKTGYNVANLPIIATRVLNEWQRIVAQRQNAEFNRRAARLLEWLPDLVGIANSDGRLTFLNRAGRSLIGIDNETELAGDRIHDLFPEWTVGAFVHVGSVAGDEQVFWKRGARLVTRTGEEIELKQAILAHVSNSSEVEYFTIVARQSSQEQ